jgi:isoleucyl-tRNA synthetase
MDQVREVCSAGSSLRKAKKLRVRLPLPKLTVAVDNSVKLLPFTDLIADELNVKAVDLTDDIAAYGRFELTVNAKAAGPRLGKSVQDAIKAVKAGRGVLNQDGTLTADEIVLTADEYSSRLVAADEEYTAALPDGGGLVVLDGTVTPELEAEGWAKDRIRELQDLRKSSGLDVSDRIVVVMAVPAERADWARTHRDLIAGEILATSFDLVDPPATVADGVEIGDGVRVAIAKQG